MRFSRLTLLGGAAGLSLCACLLDWSALQRASLDDGGVSDDGDIPDASNRDTAAPSDAGIEDRRLKLGVIPWNEVVRSFELPYFWYKNVQLQVRNPEQFKRNQPTLIRSISEMNAAFGWAPFVLVTANTDTPASAVVDYISRQLIRHWPTPAEAAGPAAPPVGAYPRSI